MLAYHPLTLIGAYEIWGAHAFHFGIKLVYRCHPLIKVRVTYFISVEKKNSSEPIFQHIDELIPFNRKLS